MGKKRNPQKPHNILLCSAFVRVSFVMRLSSCQKTEKNSVLKIHPKIADPSAGAVAIGRWKSRSFLHRPLVLVIARYWLVFLSFSVPRRVCGAFSSFTQNHMIPVPGGVRDLYHSVNKNKYKMEWHAGRAASAAPASRFNDVTRVTNYYYYHHRIHKNDMVQSTQWELTMCRSACSRHIFKIT